MLPASRRSCALRATVALTFLALLPACGSDRLQGNTPDERARAAAALGIQGEEGGVPVLRRAVDVEPELVQVEAISALGRIGTPKAVATLSELAAHESRVLRITVAQALSYVKPDAFPDAAAVLVAMGQAALPSGPGKDPHKDVRRAVTTSLAVVKQAKGLDFMLDRALHDPDEQVRNAAVKTLGRLKDPRPVDGLIEIYRTDNDRNRAWAIEALGEIGDARATPVVVEALSHPDRVTRGKAAWSLVQLEGKQAIVPLKQALAVEDNELPAVVMAHALATLGEKEAVQNLEQYLLLAKSEFARAEAGRALQTVGTCESFPAIDKAFREDRDGLVKREAGLAARNLLDKCPELLKSAQRIEQQR